MARKYWLIKSEPEEYGWDHLVRDRVGRWDGVRNYSARNHLRAMKLGDIALVYHTGKHKEVVGLAEVVKEHYPDPSATKGDFSAVDFSPVKQLVEPVTLKAIKEQTTLSQMVLVRSPRLSVQPVQPAEFREVMKMANTKFT
jgi:predicted RNA-binding protein with PUA-like domain